MTPSTPTSWPSQEVDVGVARSGFVDQAAAWAEVTGLHVVFAEACTLRPAGRYGNALLTRSPARDVELLALPQVDGNEPRGAVLASVEGVTVAATHLSIHPAESEVQLRALLEALGTRPQPWVLMGDLNRTAPELRLVKQAGLTPADPTAPSFPARRPRIRIDHVAVAGLAVEAVEVLPRRRASDHRPVAVDARIAEVGAPFAGP